MALSGDDLEKINQIMENALSGIKASMVTKAELNADLELLESRSASKADLERLATKTGLEYLASKADLECLATKTDLECLATKTDLEKLVTKADFDRLEGHLVASVSIIERDAFMRLDEHESAALPTWNRRGRRPSHNND